jgi:hypothetical protein
VDTSPHSPLGHEFVPSRQTSHPDTCSRSIHRSTHARQSPGSSRPPDCPCHHHHPSGSPERPQRDRRPAEPWTAAAEELPTAAPLCNPRSAKSTPSLRIPPMLLSPPSRPPARPSPHLRARRTASTSASHTPPSHTTHTTAGASVPPRPAPGERNQHPSTTIIWTRRPQRNARFPSQASCQPKRLAAACTPPLRPQSHRGQDKHML